MKRSFYNDAREYPIIQWLLLYILPRHELVEKSHRPDRPDRHRPTPNIGSSMVRAAPLSRSLGFLGCILWVYLHIFSKRKITYFLNLFTNSNAPIISRLPGRTCFIKMYLSTNEKSSRTSHSPLLCSAWESSARIQGPGRRPRRRLHDFKRSSSVLRTPLPCPCLLYILLFTFESDYGATEKTIIFTSYLYSGPN